MEKHRRSREWAAALLLLLVCACVTGCGGGASSGGLRSTARADCAALAQMLTDGTDEDTISKTAPVRNPDERAYLRAECPEALDQLAGIDARTLAAARQANHGDTCSPECDALDRLHAAVLRTGLPCTGWVRWETSGPMRVVDSEASGACADQAIVLAVYPDAAALSRALAYRSNVSPENFVYGRFWLANFTDVASARRFAAQTGGTLRR